MDKASHLDYQFNSLDKVTSCYLIEYRTQNKSVKTIHDIFIELLVYEVKGKAALLNTLHSCRKISETYRELQGITFLKSCDQANKL